MLELLLIGAASVALDPEVAAHDGQYRGTPRLPPAAARLAAETKPMAATAGATVFLNFEGAELNDDGEDSRSNSTLIGYEGPFAGYGEGAKRAAVVQAVREDWQAFDATITESRPQSGDYTMVMVGPTNFTEGSLGVALLDCGNKWTSNNIVYAFHDIDDNFTAAATATTIGQEVAHSFGLEHVDAPEDLMHPYNTGGDPAFRNHCEALVPAPGIGIMCTDQHEESCGTEDRQNSHSELLRQLGPRPVDNGEPTVELTAPEDGATFSLGETFVIAVHAEDDDVLHEVSLLHEGTVVATDDAEPFSWEVADAAVGSYRFTARARDMAGNETTTAEFTIHVVSEGMSSAGDGSGGDTDEGQDTDDGIPDFGSTGDSPDAGFDDDDELPDESPNDTAGPAGIPESEDPFQPFGPDCACTTDSAPPQGWMALLLGLIGLVGRKRRRSY